jgi:hypothetical protein
LGGGVGEWFYFVVGDDEGRSPPAPLKKRGVGVVGVFGVGVADVPFYNCGFGV